MTSKGYGPLLFISLFVCNIYGQEYCNKAQGLHKGLNFMKTNRIAVMDFEYTGKNSAQVGRLVSDELVACLLRYKRFVIVERSKIQQIMKELELRQSGLLKSEELQKVGRGLNVSALVVGNVADWNNGARVNARLVDVETLEVLVAENADIDRVWEKKPIEIQKQTVSKEAPGFSHDILVGYGLGFFSTPIYKPVTSYVNLLLGYRGMDMKNSAFFEFGFMKSFVFDQALKLKDPVLSPGKISGGSLTSYMFKFGFAFHLPEKTEFAKFYFGGGLGISRTGITLVPEDAARYSVQNEIAENDSEFSWMMPYDLLVGVRFISSKGRSYALEYRYSNHLDLSTDNFKQIDLSQHFLVTSLGF